MPTKEEARQAAADMRAYAKFVRERGHLFEGGLPVVRVNTVYLTRYDYESKLQEDGTYKYESILDEDATRQAVKDFLDAVGTPVTKEYTDESIRITREFGSFSIVGVVSKALTCRKVVKGKKFIQAQLIPARFEEEYEYKCDTNAISLKKLVG